MNTPQPTVAPSTADLDAARLLLARMGLSARDLLDTAPTRPPVPTFAEYVPVVAAAVGNGTRRVYGSYWNRILDHWADRRLDDPTPSEIKQLVEHVKHNVVARRNARGGRSAGEHLVAALRCLYPPFRTRRPHQPRRQPRPQGRQAPTPALDPPCSRRHPARRDQPHRRHDRQRPRPRHPAAPTARRDRLPTRRRARTAPPGPRPDPVPDLPPGEGRDRPLATRLADADDPPPTPCRRTRRTP